MFTSNFEKLVSKNLTGEVELVSYRRAFGIKSMHEALPRRLVSSESEQTTFNSGSGKMSQSSSFTRFHNKQSKIKSSSKSENNIFRGNFSPGFGHSDTF
jgi:hypothetical protein